jgi:hypothetical protein
MMSGQDAEDILGQTTALEVRSVNVILPVACLVATSRDL